MKKTIIIYGSQYGSTKRYAEKLANTTGLEAIDYTKVTDLSGYDRIVFLGALYAGGVTGLKKTAEKMSQNQELIVVTIGLADPSDSANIAHIRQSLKTQIPAHFYDESHIFHLRGAIDYKHLGLKHRVMMSLLHSKVAKMPKEELNAETKAMLETYGQVVDFVDFDSLNPIIAAISNLKASKIDAISDSKNQTIHLLV